ncbi:MAG: 4-hydroxyphenylpyruvate dioxygenase [Pseudobdellovibrionaceae bacterium]|nr:4-hydroxyphenylpyruvate dioxygenase [Bdellovibrionales bacterium]USN49040.1 MAG: 4-hydroxyphenylpyruvate dioxygenase [Pseudobdellovibrionaceae bacterium]
MSQRSSEAFNPVGLEGMEFIEYASPDPDALEELFYKLGFKKIAQHKSQDVGLFRQGGVNFILNKEKGSFADEFRDAHGPSVCATGFRVKDAKEAFKAAVERGARPVEAAPFHSFPAIYGIGDSVVYFVDHHHEGKVYEGDFNYIGPTDVPGFGAEVIDHMTNNVPLGQMQQWCDFYEKVFNFSEQRYFDIKGESTGLISKVMRSPCKKIIIPINEPSDSKSQIQEYLDEYKGSGIQHIALLTNDIIQTVSNMRRQGIDFLEVPDTYYELLPERMPQISEDIDVLRDLKILVDGDDEGYLLQIFTKTLIGPIFYEIIQRKNHNGFGEGNFQALFDSIELDQKRRGYL